MEHINRKIIHQLNQSTRMVAKKRMNSSKHTAFTVHSGRSYTVFTPADR